MDVLYKIEKEGSRDGTPKSKVVIADSGELAMPDKAATEAESQGDLK